MCYRFYWKNKIDSFSGWLSIKGIIGEIEKYWIWLDR